ncbi:MAG: hypothetical protein WCF16_13070 [Alphaproteobacteria bacterium]
MRPTRPALSAVFTRTLLLVAGLAGLVGATAARADTPLPPDSVALTLSAEDWVETDTALVRLAVDSAMEADAVAAARGRIKAALAALVPGAEWHITDFNRDRDASGLERWHLVAEARVPEAALDGLYDRAKKASRPGEQMTVIGIDFVPTVAEREKVLAGLRATLYGRVKDELARLNGVYSDRSFRVRAIDFGGLVRPLPMETKAYARGVVSESAPASSAAPIGVAEKVQVTANVILAADPPKPSKE